MVGLAFGRCGGSAGTPVIAEMVLHLAPGDAVDPRPEAVGPAQRVHLLDQDNGNVLQDILGGVVVADRTGYKRMELFPHRQDQTFHFLRADSISLRRPI